MAATRLGHYILEKKTGFGGLGEVYRAYDTYLRRPVAVKILRDDFREDTGRENLLAEARASSALNHPNICTIYEVGEADGQAYIAMELVDGKPLRDLIPPQGMDVETAVRYGIQIADALAHGHERGVCHGDLTSSNIMVDADDRIRVVDFGLAKRFAVLPPTQPSSGKTNRLRPAIQEEIQRFGAILYEMATGLMLDSRSGPIPPLQTIAPALRVPAHRSLIAGSVGGYEEMGEARDDLRSGLSSLSHARAAQSRGRLPARAKWAMSFTAPLVLLGLVLGILHWRKPGAAAAKPGQQSALRASVSANPGASTVLDDSNLLSVGIQSKFLAVLPFRALGEQASLHYIAEGMTEALSAKLFPLAGLHLISAETVELIAGTKPTDEIARELGVNLGVTGVVQETAEHLQVIVHIEDFKTHRVLWSQEFVGARADILKLEGRVFVKVVAALGLTPTGTEMTVALRTPTENVEAYDLYLRGRDAIRNYKSVQDISVGIDFYERALKQDPRFALAYAGLADASLEMYGQKKESFWAERALHAAQEALYLRPNLAEVHFAAGSVYLSTGRDQQAIGQFERGLKLSPKSDEGYRRLGSAYLAAGRKKEAIQGYQKAIELSPYYSGNYQMLGDAYLDLGDNDRALAAYRQVLQLEPESAAGYEDLGAVYFRQGQWNECIPMFEKAVKLQPYYDTYSNLGSAYFYVKRYDEAAKMFEKAVEMDPKEEVAVGNLADAYRWSGHQDLALRAYRRAIGLAYQELQVNPNDAATMSSLALYYAKTGNDAKASEFIRRARSLDRDNVELVYVEVVVDVLGHRPKDAIKTLREALKRGYSPIEVKDDPEMNGLRSSPEFGKLMQEFPGKSG